jgi:hypothetical protein
LRSLLLLTLIGLGASVFSITIHPVNAIGLVYVSPAQQGPFSSGTTVTYQVKVQNMDPFNGWDIKVAVDNNKNALNLTSLTITPDLFQTNFNQRVDEYVNCVNGGLGIPFNQPGNIGCTAFDGPDIAHSFGVISARPANIGMTTPVNGTLFTISYVASTGILTSVRITDVLISDGTATPVPNEQVGGIYGAGKLPLVNFTWTPTLPAPAQPVTFNASSTTDPNPGATIISYGWTFGDGSNFATSTLDSVQHSFKTESSGGFNVVLTVTDDIGISNSISKSVVVLRVPSDDLAVLAMQLTREDNIPIGTIARVRVTVDNVGTLSEKGWYLNVTVEGQVIRLIQYNTTLARGGDVVISVDWNTAGLNPGSYKVTAQIPALRASNGTIIEQNLANNIKYRIVRLVPFYTGSLLSLSLPETLGVGVIVMIAIGVVWVAFSRSQAGKKMRSQALD